MNAVSLHPEVKTLAEKFWAAAGNGNQRPLDLYRAVALTLPLDLISISNLSMQSIQSWLRSRGINYRFPFHSRHLRGYLLAYRGAGIVFIDGADSDRERRFTLAHETAHFLLDYLLLREQAVRTFGPGIMEVLDGNRPATASELVDAALVQVSVRPYIHLLEHQGGGNFSRENVLRAENKADALAIELLAPSAWVSCALKDAGALANDESCQRAAEHMLLEYGLPEVVAKRYSKKLSEALTGGPSVLEEWGLSPDCLTMRQSSGIDE